jgi:hypothetical protein
LRSDAGQKLHQNRLLQLARQAGQTAVYQFKGYEQARRHGTLVALMIETSATLTDEIIDLNDRLIGSFFTKSKHKYERASAEQGKAINEKVRLYAKVGAALVDARERRRDPFAAALAKRSFNKSVFPYLLKSSRVCLRNSRPGDESRSICIPVFDHDRSSR